VRLREVVLRLRRWFIEDATVATELGTMSREFGWIIVTGI
jgi:hypothetical protein